MGDEDYYKLIEESDLLAKTIARQKAKIANICDKVKDCMENSRSDMQKSSSSSYSPLVYIRERPCSASPYICDKIIEENTEEYKT